MNQKKAAVTVMIVVIMGLIIMLITVFVPATSVARQFGWLSAKNTEASYVKIAEQIREIGQKGQGTRTQALLIKMDSDSAILGFSSGSQGIKIIRDGGMDFEFPRPPECGPASCVCLCKQIEHTTVFGKEAYYCKASQPGEVDPKKIYMECENDLGVDIQYAIKKDNFATEGTNYIDYGTEGGFFLGRATTTGGSIKSGVFDIPDTGVQIWVEKGSSAFVAVCLNKDGCIDQAADQIEKNRIEATKLYNSAFDSFKENTPESLVSAAKDYDSIVANQGYVDALKTATLMEQAYFNRAMTQYRLNNYEKAVELLNDGITAIGESSEGSEWRKTFFTEREKISCDMIKKDCSCYSNSNTACTTPFQIADFCAEMQQELCEKSELKCFAHKSYGTGECSSCSNVKACSDYSDINYADDDKKDLCTKNACGIANCAWNENEKVCASG
jgi:hypothetical protein